jgi:predicted ATPase
MVERPDIAESLGEPERALLARLAGLATDHPGSPVHRHAVLHLVSRVLAATGASRAMLFVDDLQYVDDDTLALAELLASAAMPRGVLLLASYRPGVDDRANAMTRSMVARGVGVEISLGPLSRSESDAMVVNVLDRPASDVELDLAWKLSDGIPFFALEVAAALSADQPAPASGAYGAVDVRLERLPAATRDALRSVAIVAQQFTADEFAVLGALEGDRALEHLEVAVSLGVVARQGSSYRFRHDLVCERLTEAVSETERADAHAGARQKREKEPVSQTLLSVYDRGDLLERERLRQLLGLR